MRDNSGTFFVTVASLTSFFQPIGAYGRPASTFVALGDAGMRNNVPDQKHGA
ncbi:hypothetical protein [Streptomyces sp. NBC_00557]|uniref:hypothetical protein n=1 Tax=Streptomyces sp. NBC_00557 TaxID=2975776 RepID=UPI002E821FA3|nr:hypothetical protein [Streptomyces sp. NBC_00557]WUC32841.1 hypothetical protein OG956_00670 [Streptomyces sp. NBC_00557]